VVIREVPVSFDRSPQQAYNAFCDGPVGDKSFKQ
jgi:hypothetical protein